jgi:putative metalloprotease
MPVWLMSHPKTEERIAAIEQLEARWRQVPQG